MKTFLWIEDRRGKASYTFWKEFLTQIFPEVELESKRNSSELVKAVKNLNDSENKYIIVFDNSFDNLQAVMVNNLGSVSLLSGLWKPQIRF